MAEKIIENLIMPRHGPATVFKELLPVRSDILARQVHTGLFTGSYRFRRSLLAMLALKYAATLETYTEEEDEDSLLIGQAECEKALAQPTGMGMEKVAAFLAAQEDKPADIQAILLLEADFSDENRQKFLIRTKKKALSSRCLPGFAELACPFSIFWHDRRTGQGQDIARSFAHRFPVPGMASGTPAV